MSEDLIKVRGLNVTYKTSKGVFGKPTNIYAVNGVSLTIKQGEIFAVAGESGCGKSTLAKAILQLVPTASGEIFFKNQNIFKMTKPELKNYKQKAQMVFQNPYSSLNPKMTIFETLAEPLKINTDLGICDIEKTIKEKLILTGLDESCLKMYPHEFSGGQRQRIAITRALMLNPEFILADEPVSALDVSIQAQIINLIKELKEKCNLTFLLITHDLSVIKYLADRVAVMYLGEIVEYGLTEKIFKTPKHPYTKALLSSAPQITKNNSEKIILKGDLPSPANLPDGCKFHTRCPYAMEKCRQQVPFGTEISPAHTVRCFLYDS